MTSRSARATRQRVKPQDIQGFSSGHKLPQALRKFRGSSFVFMLLAIVGSFHALSMIGIETYRILTNVREIDRLNAEIAVLKEEITTIDAVILHTDDTYMEQLARCREGFVFPNETRYITDLPAEASKDLTCRTPQ
jgi:cell division protein FtsB